MRAPRPDRPDGHDRPDRSGTRPDPADVLVALNATIAVPRASVCRLASEHARWLTSSGWPLVPPDLEVPAAHLRRALELATGARARAAAERRAAAGHGARVVSALDAGYPQRFFQLALPPPAIFLVGAELVEGPAVAIVGARHASRHGLEIARWFARELAAAGVTILSGFAVGVDAAAHRATLAVGGRTVAILGCGLGVDYPSGHRALGAEIAAAGTVLTEFPCGRLPARWQFPVRNRLIAALADACLVIEAAPRSGSLVTARWALELGREVLAVPGRLVDELALGTNRLIADGARPALQPDDVLEALALPARATARRALDLEAPPSLSEEQRLLWLAAREGTAPPEALAARAGLAIERALATLLELELAGQLRRTSAGAYEILG